MEEFKSVITGHLDILVHENEDEFEGVNEMWYEVLIHGDPEGLGSLANVLLKIADLDQNAVAELPIGAREHIHLTPNHELAASSVAAIVGRLDAKGTSAFYDAYIAKEKK